MRKLIDEFFYIPKQGKVREKVMLTRVITTITVMVMCLIAMSFTAYAYFSHNVASVSNVVKTVKFKTEVKVEFTGEDGKTKEISPKTSDNRLFEIEGLEAGKTYTVTIKKIKENNAAKTGFVIVSADNCRDTYHTQQLGIDANVDGGETEEVSFKLNITDSTVVYLKAHWGTSSSYPNYQNKGEEFYIINGEEIQMTVNVKETPPAKTSKDKTNTALPSATESTTPSAESTIPSEQTTVPEPVETSEPTSTVEPSTSTAEPTTTQPTETTSAEPSVPETTAPETTAPETTAPETTAPETTAPETTAPETTAPETTAPETTAPETTEQLLLMAENAETEGAPTTEGERINEV